MANDGKVNGVYQDQEGNDYLCLEDIQECHKCPRSKTDCLIGIISQNHVKEVR